MRPVHSPVLALPVSMARPALTLATSPSSVGLVERMAALAVRLHRLGMPFGVLSVATALRVRDGLDVLGRLHSMRAALGSHIGHVVVRRAEPEVVGSDAWRVIAAVQDKEAVRDRAVRQYPSPAVGARLAASIPAALDDPIRLAVPVARPDPAVTRLVHAGPEPLVHASILPFAWRELHPDPTE